MGVTASSRRPQWHVELDDGSTTVGLTLCNSEGERDARAIRRDPLIRTSLKTFEGSPTYSDFELPYTPIDQNDWSGGRGQEEFERDKTRFSDSYRINSWMEGKLMLGPQVHYSTGLLANPSINQYLPGSVAWKTLSGSDQYVAIQFTATTNYTMKDIYLWVRRRGTPGDTLTVDLMSDNAGAVGAKIDGVTYGTGQITDTVSVFYRFRMPASHALTYNTEYWVKIYDSGSPDSSNYWQVGVDSAGSLGTTDRSSDGSSWSDAAYDLYYRVIPTIAGQRYHFFEYKRALYAVTQPDGGTAGKLYINGWRGVATGTQTSTTLQDTNQSWTAGALVGDICYIAYKTGKWQWRSIVGNTSDTITVSPAWDIQPATTVSLYTILGDDSWSEVATTGITKPVSDVFVTDSNIVHFCQDDATNMRVMRYRGSDGHSYADDGEGGWTGCIKNHPDGMQI